MDDAHHLEETSYRKGYYNGYERAFLDLQEMINSRYDPNEAILHGLEFVVDDLKRWRYGNPETLVVPPASNPKMIIVQSTRVNNYLSPEIQ